MQSYSIWVVFQHFGFRNISNPIILLWELTISLILSYPPESTGNSKMTWVCLYASFVEFLASPVLSLHLLPRIMQTMKIPTQWHGDTLGNLVWLLWASGAISINKHYIH
jgi:hypothetical protein